MVKLKHTESTVRYNQSGYVGQSMSVRAKNAYDAGEMPKTKWTKSAIMDVLYTLFGDAASGFNRFSRQDLFDNLCTYSSWHHTGKYANATNFYTIDRNTALLFADKNNIESMRDIIENDEE